MKTSEAGLALIKSVEGFRGDPYLCSAGKLTIGYGHVILPHEKDTLKHVTQEQAEKLLQADLKKAEDAVTAEIGDTHPLIFDALVSFTFNLGTGAFKNSTLLKHIKQNKYALAALQFCKWDNAGGREVDGLENRRAKETLIFTAGAIAIKKMTIEDILLYLKGGDTK